MYAQGPAPGMRGPRTRFTSPRSPLTRRPLGGSKTRIAAVMAVSLVSCAACGQSKVQHESSASPSHSPLTLGRQATSVVPVNAHRSAGHSMSRLIIFGATGPLDAARRRPWIDWLHTTVDQAAMIRNFIKWDAQPLSVSAAIEAVLRANMIAQTAPKGPVYITLDVSLQEQEIDAAPPMPDMRRFQPFASPISRA